MPKEPTLQDIADQLGTTKATVSMALRDHPRVSEAMRVKVKKKADEMGYRTNPLVAAHMANLRRTKSTSFKANLAFLHDHPHKDQIIKTNMPEAYLYRGAKKKAEQLGYAIEPFSLYEPGMSHRRLGQILKSRGVVGLVMSGLNQIRRPNLNWKDFASVAIGYTLSSPKISRVCHDHYSAINDTIERLQSLGYKRIGFAMREIDDTRSEQLWKVAYLNYQYNLPDTQKLPILLTASAEDPAIMKWYCEHSPEVILSGNHFFYTHMRKQNVKFPNDVSYINLSWMPEFSEQAGYSHDFYKLGSAAIDAITAALYRNERGIPADPKTILIQGQWKTGKSLKPLHT